MLKTPSRIAYASENPNLSQDTWGAAVDASMLSYSWTKLLLDERTAATDFDDPSLSDNAGAGIKMTPIGKDATTVCADFLRFLYKHTMDELERHISHETLSITPLEFFFTLPAIWSDRAKGETASAARRAGFGSLHGDKIGFVKEPEAAAVTVLKKMMLDGDQIKVRENTYPRLKLT